MFNEHFEASTVPEWIANTFGCETPVYENSEFAFGAELQSGCIGSLSWMSDSSPESCAAVLAEAKGRFVSGMYLPGRAHVPDFPVGEHDAIIDIPSLDVSDDSVRCVLFDVLKPLEVTRPPLLPVRLRLPCSTSVPHASVFGDDEIEDRGGTGRERDLLASRLAQVSEAPWGVRVHFDRPVVFFRQPNREMSVVSAVTGTAGSLVVDPACFDVNGETEQCFILFSGKEFQVFFERPLWILKGIYMEYSEVYFRADYEDFWTFGRPFFEVVAARVVQRAWKNFRRAKAARVVQREWKRLACDPHHPVGNRLLRKHFFTSN